MSLRFGCRFFFAVRELTFPFCNFFRRFGYFVAGFLTVRFSFFDMVVFSLKQCLRQDLLPAGVLEPAEMEPSPRLIRLLPEFVQFLLEPFSEHLRRPDQGLQRHFLV